MAGLSRELILTMVLQGSGAAAVLVAAMWIGLALDPQAQGLFNALKSLVDLGAALAMLGMPQALYVFVQRGLIELQAAMVIAGRVGLVGLPVGFALVALSPIVAGPTATTLIASAVALCTLHGQWRALALLASRPLAFNLATVVPQWALLALAALLVTLHRADPALIAAGLAAAWSLGAAVARRTLRPLAGERNRDAPPLAALARHGAATWLTTSLAAAGIVVVQQLALVRGGGTGLGHVSMAIMLAQIPLTPLNYALPILLRHRLRQAPGEAFAGRLPFVVLPILLLAAGVLTAGLWRTDLGLGPGYANVHRLVAWMLVAGAADGAVRLLSVDTQAAGRPWHSSLAEIVRLVVFAAGAFCVGGLGAADAVEALARWWALAAFAAAAVLHFAVARR